jgi:hypothetical protein
VEFPELQPGSLREPRWTFEIHDCLPERTDLREIGDQHIYGDVHARLFAFGSGYRITVDDTGTFDIEEDGARISFEEKPGAWPDFVRAHLVGRVMATALFSSGLMPLHGSAVHLGEGVIGFLAPKGYGKSTLALALTHMGGRLVTDDTLPVELAKPVRAWPGVHSVRIKPDSLAALGRGDADLETREGKGVVTSLSDGSRAMLPAPLAAIYLLLPVGGTLSVRRERLPSVQAALALMGNFKLARMTGAASMPEVLRRAAAIADSVPVFRLLIPRDFEALSGAAGEIMSWHAGAHDASPVVPS